MLRIFSQSYFETQMLPQTHHLRRHTEGIVIDCGERDSEPSALQCEPLFLFDSVLPLDYLERRELRATTGRSSMNGWTFSSLITIEEVQQIATDWLWTDNKDRPNNGHLRDYTRQKLKMAS
jgi:hypothetical protein